jgi:hypothetical protein
LPRSTPRTEILILIVIPIPPPENAGERTSPEGGAGHSIKPVRQRAGRPDAARKRERWKAHQASIDPARLVFIDETLRGGRLWVKTNMTPLRGWGPKGPQACGQGPGMANGKR